jgi:diaminopimelate epimerase
MQINFTKMHGLGNDFVVIDAINQDISLNTEQIRFIANRHFGIGCDQLLLVESSDVLEADFGYRIFNADGGEVEQCGNGARCFAHFVQQEGLTDKTEISVITSTGLIVLKTGENGQVTVDMGVPTLDPHDIPFVAEAQKIDYSLNIAGREVKIGAVSMGNPHAVLVVDDVNNEPVEQLGKAIQADERFPNSVNVGFMQIIDQQHIKLRVYERGVGETQACGTGACAAVVVGQIQGLLEGVVDAKLLGGNLSIHWAGENNPVMMTGPSTTVFKGTISL